MIREQALQLIEHGDLDAARAALNRGREAARAFREETSRSEAECGAKVICSSLSETRILPAVANSCPHCGNTVCLLVPAPGLFSMTK